MKTKDVVHYLEGTVCLAEIDSSYIDEAVRMIKCGENCVDMWAKFKDNYGCYYYKESIDEYVTKMTPIVELINKLEVEFFGSITKKDLINNILEEVYKLNIHPRADRVDVINMLIKLRDKEEDV